MTTEVMVTQPASGPTSGPASSTAPTRRRQPRRTCRRRRKPDPSPKPLLFPRVFARTGPQYQVTDLEQRMKQPVVSRAAYRSSRPGRPLRLSRTIPDCPVELEIAASIHQNQKAIISSNRAKTTPSTVASFSEGSSSENQHVETTLSSWPPLVRSNFRPMAVTSMRPPTTTTASSYSRATATTTLGKTLTSILRNNRTKLRNQKRVRFSLPEEKENSTNDSHTSGDSRTSADGDANALRPHEQPKQRDVHHHHDPVTATSKAQEEESSRKRKAQQQQQQDENDTTMEETAAETTLPPPPRKKVRKSHVATVRRNRAVFTHDLISHVVQARQALGDLPLQEVNKALCKLVVICELNSKMQTAVVHARSSSPSGKKQQPDKEQCEHHHHHNKNEWMDVSKTLQGALNGLVQKELDLAETVLPKLDQLVTCWNETQAIASSKTSTPGSTTSRPIWMPALIQELDETAELLNNNMDMDLATSFSSQNLLLHKHVIPAIQQFQNLWSRCLDDATSTTKQQPSSAADNSKPLPSTDADKVLLRLRQMEQELNDKVTPMMDSFVKAWVPTTTTN